MVARAMTLPGALLLDLDDTILDAYGNRDAAWRPLCAEFARLLGTVTADELRAAIIESATWVWSDPERARRARLDLRAARRMVVRGAFTHLGIGNTPVADTMADRFSAVREAAVKPFPGAIDTLRRLRAANVRLALLTNGAARSQRAKIARFGLEPFFDHIQIEEEFGVGKPDERAFRHALSALGVQADDAWMVGDNLDWDIQGAQRVGIYAVWVDAVGEGMPDGYLGRKDCQTSQASPGLSGSQRKGASCDRTTEARRDARTSRRVHRARPSGRRSRWCPPSDYRVG